MEQVPEASTAELSVTRKTHASLRGELARVFAPCSVGVVKLSTLGNWCNLRARISAISLSLTGISVWRQQREQFLLRQGVLLHSVAISRPRLSSGRPIYSREMRISAPSSGDWGSLDILSAFGAEYVGSNPASPTFLDIDVGEFVGIRAGRQHPPSLIILRCCRMKHRLKARPFLHRTRGSRKACETIGFHID